VLLPRSDAINQASIGVRCQVLTQPSQIDLPLPISASRLVLNVAGFPVPPQQATHRRFAHSEQRRCRSVCTAFLRPVRLYQSPSKIDRRFRHPDV
jgi:hypothetical protein